MELLAVFFAHGEPEKEYIKAIDFCSSDQFIGEEQDWCKESLFNKMSHIYPKSKVEFICRSIDERFRDDCINVDFEGV